MKAGRFVVLVGPDGVGKTTLAGALLERWSGPAGYFHFCPMLGAPLEPHPDSDPPPPPPKAPRDGLRLWGWLRLGRNLLRFWLAYWIRIKPAVRRGSLVVGDRWAYGYVGQPHGLRFYGPQWLARFAMGLFPVPDAVVSMSAPVSVIRSRKQELEESEIEAELERWASVRGRRTYLLDATATPERMAETVLAGIGS